MPSCYNSRIMTMKWKFPSARNESRRREIGEFSQVALECLILSTSSLDQNFLLPRSVRRSDRGVVVAALTGVLSRTGVVATDVG